MYIVCIVILTYIYIYVYIFFYYIYIYIFIYRNIYIYIFTCVRISVLYISSYNIFLAYSSRTQVGTTWLWDLDPLKHRSLQKWRPKRFFLFIIYTPSTQNDRQTLHWSIFFNPRIQTFASVLRAHDGPFCDLVLEVSAGVSEVEFGIGFK